MSLVVHRAHSGDLDALSGMFDAYRQFYDQAPDVAAARAFLAERIDRAESVVLMAWNEDPPAEPEALEGEHLEAAMSREPLQDGLLTLLPAGEGGAERRMRGREATTAPSGDSSISLVRPLTPAPLPVGEGLQGRPPGAAIGFVQLYPLFSSVRLGRTWLLNDLYVVANARRLGAARALLDAACAFAREGGALGLELETGRDNLNAQALYRSAGWELSENLHFHLSVANAKAGDPT